MFRSSQESGGGSGERWIKASDRFRPPPAHEAVDRRSAPRYPIRPRQVRLVWRGETGGLEAEGQILEVALGGALIVTTEPPTPGGLLTVWLGNHTAGIRLDAKVVAVSPDQRGLHRVHVAFPSGCPYEAFKRLAWAPSDSSAP